MAIYYPSWKQFSVDVHGNPMNNSVSQSPVQYKYTLMYTYGQLLRYNLFFEPVVHEAAFLANLYPELSFLAVARISVDCSWQFCQESWPQ